jgi:hypothetical protein
LRMRKLQASSEDTVRSAVFTGRPARVYKNAYVRDWEVRSHLRWDRAANCPGAWATSVLGLIPIRTGIGSRLRRDWARARERRRWRRCSRAGRSHTCTTSRRLGGTVRAPARLKYEHGATRAAPFTGWTRLRDSYALHESQPISFSQASARPCCGEPPWWHCAIARISPTVALRICVCPASRSQPASPSCARSTVLVAIEQPRNGQRTGM